MPGTDCTQVEPLGRHTLIHGDCIEAMRLMPDASVDAIVTDPPYGLGFMGKKWDALPPGLDFAKEAHRVLKPGGHIVAFGGQRTIHRLVCSLEDGGFEIRDIIGWAFWSGFPKSLDVSKAIDKAAGVRGPVVGERPAYGIGGHAALGGHAAGATAKVDAGPATPEAAQWSGWGTALKPCLEYSTLAQKPHDLTSLSATLVRQMWRSLCRLRSFARDAGIDSGSSQSAFGVGASDSALWTAVERSSTPAALFGLMATSPSGSAGGICWSIACSWLNTLGAILSGGNTFTTETATSLTIALRTLKFSAWPITPAIMLGAAIPGTGDGSSAAAAAATFNVAASMLRLTRSPTAPGTATSSPFAGDLKPTVVPATLARKPLISTVAANVLEHGTGALNIDGCRYAYGDPAWPGPGEKRWARGTTKAHGGFEGKSFSMPERCFDGVDGHPIGKWPANIYYCPKASRREREAGLGHLRKGRRDPTRADDAPGGNNPRNRGAQERANTHATVKPIALMRWLVRLVTPPGGVVLEPFAGSGTTIVAAELEGFRCIGVERSDEYLPIIRGRVEHAIRHGAKGFEAQPKNPDGVLPGQVGLFA